ncbi:hypothetical protein [Alteromonas facilis]|uniref:hypothetical protein n=1 Tax=Alteromonas facilis TaxID=2048004 RepID=UPI000C288742|nr:hypothetical protein [Alteromonas facilis]
MLKSAKYLLAILCCSATLVPYVHANSNQIQDGACSYTYAEQTVLRKKDKAVNNSVFTSVTSNATENGCGNELSTRSNELNSSIVAGTLLVRKMPQGHWAEGNVERVNTSAFGH